MNSNPLHPEVQDRVQERLELLYKLDKRDDPAHPRFATYTGLHQEASLDALVERQGLADSGTAQAA
jgi:hypothetical protein